MYPCIRGKIENLGDVLIWGSPNGFTCLGQWLIDPAAPSGGFLWFTWWRWQNKIDRHTKQERKSCCLCVRCNLFVWELQFAICALTCECQHGGNMRGISAELSIGAGWWFHIPSHIPLQNKIDVTFSGRLGVRANHGICLLYTKHSATCHILILLIVN